MPDATSGSVHNPTHGTYDPVLAASILTGIPAIFSLVAIWLVFRLLRTGRNPESGPVDAAAREPVFDPETEQFLADAADLLIRSIDYEDTLDRVARVAVPRFADWCVVDLLESGTVRRLVSAHRDPKLEQLTREMTRRYPLDLIGSNVVAQVLRNGRPMLIREITPDLFDDLASNQDHANMLKKIGAVSAVVAPLLVRGKNLGAISFMRDRSRRRYYERDVQLAEQLARRVAVALDNSLLYREAQAARMLAERRAREEAALREATEAVTATFTVEEVIQQIASSALSATDADGAVVERIEVNREVVVVAVAGQRILPLGARLVYPGSLAQYVIEHERPELIPVLTAETQRISADLVAACPQCSALAVPLIDAGDAIGCLILLREPDREFFQPTEVERAKTFANLASLAFRKVHLLEETEQRREELERLIESRARLIRGFSHDVKNPLGAADGRAQLLEDGVMGSLTDQQKDSIRGIRRSIGSALELINTLVEIARVEAGQIAIAQEPVDVREIAREIAEEYRAQADTSGLVIEYSAPDRFPVIISDASRIRQILGNLVSNAVKYTPEGKVTVIVGMKDNPASRQNESWATVDVVDTGIGIPKDKQNLIFQEFTRLGEDSRPGVGLGLAISYRIARAIGGNITVESEPGKGSTFTLWLPPSSEKASQHQP